MAGMDWLAQDTANRVGDFMDDFRAARASNAAAKADAAAKAKNEAAREVSKAAYVEVTNAFNNGFRKSQAEVLPLLKDVAGRSDFNFINAQAWQRTAEMAHIHK